MEGKGIRLTVNYTGVHNYRLHFETVSFTLSKRDGRY